MTAKVTCIIPAWNEADRIGSVLQAVLFHPEIDEVLVIDDASTDRTSEIAKSLGAKVLRLERNGGKSAAIAAGIAAANGDFLVFLDADLIGLSASDVTKLLSPVLQGQADAAISLRRNAPWPWRVIGLDYISGERVMSRSFLLDHIDHIAGLRRFGLEVFLNGLWISCRVRLCVVPLAAKSPLKAEKHGLIKGLIGDVGMMRDIFQTAGFWQPLQQIRELRRLSQPARMRRHLDVSQQV